MICNAFPESEEAGAERTIVLEEHIRNRVQKEARDNQGKSICYLVVSHGCHIDSIAKIYELSPEFNGQEYEKEERDKIMNLLVPEQYGYPYFCAMSGFVAT